MRAHGASTPHRHRTATAAGDETAKSFASTTSRHGTQATGLSCFRAFRFTLDILLSFCVKLYKAARVLLLAATCIVVPLATRVSIHLRNSTKRHLHTKGNQADNATMRSKTTSISTTLQKEPPKREASSTSKTEQTQRGRGGNHARATATSQQSTVTAAFLRIPRKNKKKQKQKQKNKKNKNKQTEKQRRRRRRRRRRQAGRQAGRQRHPRARFKI